jgi:tetratricopeptide (TPR) repeat protein
LKEFIYNLLTVVKLTPPFEKAKFNIGIILINYNLEFRKTAFLPLLNKKMRKNIIVFLSLLINSFGFGQKSEIPDFIVQFEYSIEHEQDSNVVKFGRKTGEYMYSIGLPDSAKYYFTITSIFAKNINDYENENFSYQMLAICNAITGNYMEAEKYIESSISIGKRNKDSIKISKSLYLKGKIYEQQGKLNEAIKIIESSLKIAKESNNQKQIQDCFSLLGNINAVLGNNKKALEYYNMNYNYAFETGDSVRMHLSLGNQGIIYKRMSDYDSALKCQLLALKICKERNDKISIAKAYTNIGIIYSNTKEYEKALENYLLALEIKKEMKSQKDIATTLNNIGILYYRLNDFKKSIEYLLQGETISKEIKSINELRHANEYLALSYSKLNDFENAFIHQIKYQKYNDSISSIETKNKISELEIKYETEQKEQDNKILTQQNELQQTQLEKKQARIRFFIILLVLLISSIATLIYLYEKKQRYLKMLAKKNLEIAKASKPRHEKYNNHEEGITEKHEEIYKNLKKRMKNEKLYTDTELTADKLSKLLDTNRTDLSIVFKHFVKDHYNNYINQQRINHAIRLFSDSKQNYLSNEGIAKECGFNSVSTFYKTFKEVTGMTPSAFRKNGGNTNLTSNA